MNKVVKKILLVGAAGAILTAGTITCSAEENTAASENGGIFGSIVGEILSNLTEENVKGVTDAISAVVSEDDIKGVTDALSAVISEEDIKGVTDALSAVISEEDIKGVTDALSAVISEDDIKGVTDALSEIVSEEKINEGIQSIMNSDTVNDVLQFAGELGEAIPEDVQQQVMEYLGSLFADEMGIEGDAPHVDSVLEIPDNIHELTKEEAEEQGFYVHLSEDMKVESYTMTEDETLGNVYDAVFEAGDGYYAYSMHSTDKTDLSEIDEQSVLTFLLPLEDSETKNTKVGDFDAEVTVLTDGTIGMIHWIDTEKGQYYRLERIGSGEGVSTACTPERMTEVANILSAAE